MQLDSSGDYTYSPAPGFVGMDRFYYVASDGIMNSNVASISINVQAGIPILDVPDIAVSDNQSTDLIPGGPTSQAFSPLLGNGNVQNVDTSQFDLLTTTHIGALSPGLGTYPLTQSLVYTVGNADGLDSFTYGFGPDVPSTTALLDVNDGYSFTWGGLGGLTYTVSHGDVLSEQDGELLNSVQYPPGGSLSVNLVSGPPSGTLTLTNSHGAADGSFTYTPAANTTGWVYFSYDVHSSDGAISPPAWAAIDVTDTLPLLPHANDTLTTYENQSQVIDPRLENQDAEHPLDTLTATVVPGMGPQNGTLTANSDGTYTYTPVPGYTGPDYFTYQVSDGVTTSTHGVVSQSDNVNGNYETMFINVQPLPVSVSIGAYAPGDPNAVIPLDDGSYVWDNQTAVNLNYPDDLLPGSIVTVNLSDNADPAIPSAPDDMSPAVNNGEGDPFSPPPGDPSGPDNASTPMGGVQLWTGYPGDPGSTQVMGAGVSIAQNPTGFSLQFVVGGDNAVPLTHSLIAYGLSVSAFDGVNLMVAVAPAAGNQTGSILPSPIPTTGVSPVTAKAPATVPAAHTGFRVNKVVLGSTNTAEIAANMSVQTNRGSDFHTIAKDDGAGNYDGSWYDASGTGDLSVNGGHADPLCFTRSGAADGNVYVSFNVTVVATDPLNGAGYVIEAVDVTTNKVLGQGTAVVEPGNKLYAAFDTSNRSVPIKSTVYRGQADIEWMVSSDGRQTWISAGDTNDKAYLTNANPDGLTAGGDAALNAAGAADASAPVASIPETVLDIGCRSATGDTTSATVLRDVSSAFAAPAAGPPSVADARGKVMTYWGAHSGPNEQDSSEFFTTAGLCEFDDGRCGAWSRLLISALAAQGVTAQYVHITPAPYVSLFYGIVPVTTFHIKPGLPAQGDPAPYNYFQDHAVMILSGADAALDPLTIFDPSYGKTYAVAGATTFAAAEQKWETAVGNMVYDYRAAPNAPAILKTAVTQQLITGTAPLFEFKTLAGSSI